MAVCRYFQQGTCRYGQNCRFEHPSPQYGGTYVSPLLRSSQPPPNVTAPRTPQVTNQSRSTTKGARDVHNIILTDIMEAEKGGVWPLSCYNFWPAVTLGNVPGIEDLSPEEMRHLQMQAQATGTIEACNQQIQLMYQQARARFDSLKIPTPEVIALIESLTRGPAAPSSQFSFARGSTVAPSTNQTSIFGGASAAAPAYGGAPSTTPAGFGMAQTTAFAPPGGQQSVFGGSSQFGAATSPQKSIFGSAGAQPQQSAFGGGGSIFGGAMPTPTPFGGNAQQTSSVFGEAPQQNSSVFGGAPQPAASVFGGASSTAQSGGSIFGGASAAPSGNASSFSFALPNAFDSNVNANAPQGANSLPFGVPVSSASSNIFGGATIQPAAQPSSHGFAGFGGPQNMNNPQQSQVTLNSSLYSSLAHLTDGEKAEFQAETFTLGNIPCRPPPRELC